MRLDTVNSISIKSKTIIFVLTIIGVLSIVFFLIRYHDISEFAHESQISQMKKVQLVYNQTLKRIRKFYITRGYANINSYGIREAFIDNNSTRLYDLSLPRWQIISKENQFLESFCFYDKAGELLTYFGKKPHSNLLYANSFKNSYDGFWFDLNSFSYHAVSIARDKNQQTIGFIVFVINPKYFLLEIRKLIDINSYIIYKKQNSKDIIFTVDDNINKGDSSTNSPLPYTIDGRGIDRENDFKIIFLQDTTYWDSIIKKAFLQGLAILFIITLVTYIVVNYGFDIILKELDSTTKKLIVSQNELKELNQNLRIRVNQEIELKLAKQKETEEKKRMLLHQSKLASMGEMIGNIAHQWKQPLTELSLLFISLQLYFERGKLTSQKLDEKVDEANKQISYMSNTIDDFRNFFVSGKEKKSYLVGEVVELVDHLLSATLNNNHIKFNIIIDDNFKLSGYPNEVAQAILNIVSNAKDMILERSIESGLIVLKTYTDQNGHHITISDNAGGVTVSPIDKIFEPYFSTKHAKSGTGIGLYMTKVIIEKNNSGTIDVSNLDNGALFSITFLH